MNDISYFISIEYGKLTIFNSISLFIDEFDTEIKISFFVNQFIKLTC